MTFRLFVYRGTSRLNGTVIIVQLNDVVTQHLILIVNTIVAQLGS